MDHTGQLIQVCLSHGLSSFDLGCCLALSDWKSVKCRTLNDASIGAALNVTPRIAFFEAEMYLSWYIVLSEVRLDLWLQKPSLMGFFGRRHSNHGYSCQSLLMTDVLDD